MMKRIWKILLSAAVTLGFSAAMFFCFVAGAPLERESLGLYLLAAGGFSLLTPVFLCICIHYILYLQKRLKDIQKNGENSDERRKTSPL